jgi:hypothetical protein
MKSCRFGFQPQPFQETFDAAMLSGKNFEQSAPFSRPDAENLADDEADAFS